MQKTEFDVIVVGGGPGGAVAASFLGRAGVDTLLVDQARFPRDKSCGDAIGGRAIPILRELGLDRRIEVQSSGVPCGRLFCSPRGDVVRIPFPSRSGSRSREREDDPLAPVCVVRRSVLDALLFQSACSYESVTPLEAFCCTDLLWDGGRVAGILGRHEDGTEATLKARIVIGADGVTSRVASGTGAVGVERKNPGPWVSGFRMYVDNIAGLTDDLEIHLIDEGLPGYLWIFPLGSGRANVGVGLLEPDLGRASGFRRARQLSLRRKVYRLLSSHPRFRGRFSEAREVRGSLRGWLLPGGGRRRPIAGPGWMLVGDAASLIDPFSGEGIANAMASARMAAACAVMSLREGDVSDSATRRYEARVWAELGPELDFSFRLQQLLRHPWLLNYLVYRSASRESVRRLVAELTTNPETRQERVGWRMLWKLAVA